MNHLKSYKSFINESLTPEEIDNLLDKISSDGLDSLSDYEKSELDNANNPNYKFENEIIGEIKSLVSKYGGYISMSDLEASSSPIYDDNDQEIHLIERLMSDSVDIVVYGGYKYETELRDYTLPYEKLSIELLTEIKTLLDIAIDHELLELDE